MDRSFWLGRFWFCVLELFSINFQLFLIWRPIKIFLEAYANDWHFLPGSFRFSLAHTVRCQAPRILEFQFRVDRPAIACWSTVLFWHTHTHALRRYARCGCVSMEIVTDWMLVWIYHLFRSDGILWFAKMRIQPSGVHFERFGSIHSRPVDTCEKWVTRHRANFKALA